MKSLFRRLAGKFHGADGHRLLRHVRHKHLGSGETPRRRKAQGNARQDKPQVTRTSKRSGAYKLLRFPQETAPSEPAVTVGQFTRNLGWLGMSAGVIRITRLLTTIVLARFLSQYDYGLAAIVLTTNEFVRVFTRNGVGVRLIQAKAEDVESLAQSAYWLNWVVFVGLFIIQCLVAFPLAWFYGDNQLIIPVCAMGIGLLLIPHGLVQVALIQRENRFKTIALVEMIQISTDNILSLIFALAGWGMWAIVLPKILVAPIWVIKYLDRINLTFCRGREQGTGKGEKNITE